MSRIFRDSSVLNQFGSPSINSNTFANRPAAGQNGRLFVSTDTLVLYRDNGSIWEVVSATGSTQNLEQTTTNGNTTTKGIFAGASGSLTTGRLLEVSGKTKLTDTSGNVLYIGDPSITPNSATLDIYGYTVLRNTVNSTSNLGPILYSQYTINYNGTGLSGFANSIFAQDIYNVSASTTVASSTQSGTSLAVNTYNFSSASTITFSQPSGSIRAASSLTAYSQFQNTASGTITHAAGICILGVENLGGSSLSITNNYQLLINASDEFASTATFNSASQWGIYQAGANDKNLFAGFIYQGNTASNWLSLQNNAIYGRAGSGLDNFYLVNYSTVVTHNGNLSWFTPSGNLVLGSSSVDSGRKLQVNGNIEITTTTATGVHTPTAQHLPIYVNGTLYYLQLLN